MVSPMSLYNRTDRLLDSDSSRGAYAGVKVRNALSTHSPEGKAAVRDLSRLDGR